MSVTLALFFLFLITLPGFKSTALAPTISPVGSIINSVAISDTGIILQMYKLISCLPNNCAKIENNCLKIGVSAKFSLYLCRSDGWT